MLGMIYISAPILLIINLNKNYDEKRFFAGLLLSGIAICHVSGQTALEGNKFSDNWSIGINVGGVTPLTHHSFFKNMRSAVGVHVSKHLTPYLWIRFLRQWVILIQQKVKQHLMNQM